MTGTEQGAGPVGPSDKEVVTALQRLASAHAHLTAAEREADASDGPATTRIDELEEAHTNLLWAQAQFITASKEHRAQKELDTAKRRERTVLKRHGFASFRDYLAERSGKPTADVHLEVARREFDAAQAEWDHLQAAVIAAQEAGVTGPSTMVIDLTDGNPRRIA